MYKGSCLCGQVKIKITGAIDSIIHCHCSKCRKSSGTAFATNGFVLTEHFEITDGKKLLSNYEASPGKFRHFCSVCASPIYSANQSSAKYVRLRLGILDSDIAERPISHNFVTSKANWENLNAKLPWYDEHEPGREKFKNTDA